MKTKNLILLLTSIFIIALISSCKKTDDTKPTFTVHEPVSGEVVITGNEIHFEADFSDDTELGQYKIDIHNNFDGHGHGKTESLTPWEESIINDLDGKSKSVHIHIDVPTDIAAGEYHFIVSCTDAAGNEADPVEIEITIQNSDDLVAPTLNITSPADHATFTAGSDIIVSGTAADNAGLETIEIVVKREADETEVHDADIDVSGTSYTINETISTTGWASGEYHLSIKAIDAVNNSVTEERHVIIN